MALLVVLGALVRPAVPPAVTNWLALLKLPAVNPVTGSLVD
jgi:ABC-type arginine transport system permease subunit